MRLTVRRVLEIIALYPDRTELFMEYPSLEEEDISQALAYAAALLDDRVNFGCRELPLKSPSNLF